MRPPRKRRRRSPENRFRIRVRSRTVEHLVTTAEKLEGRVRIAAVILWTLIASLTFVIPLLLLLPWRARRVRLAMYYGRMLAAGAFPLLGIDIQIRHRERLDQAYPAIYVSNHASNLDPFIGLHISPVGVACTVKKQIAYLPFFGQIYLLSGHILIDRANPERARVSMNSLTRLVKTERLALWVYPEGTQPRDGRLLPFKKGLVHLAVATGLPIVPIMTYDAHELWPARSFDVRPGTVTLEVLEPVDTTDWTLETAEEHLRELRALFLAHLGPGQQPLQLAPPTEAATRA